MTTPKVILSILLVMALSAMSYGSAFAGPSLWPNTKGEVCLMNTDTGGLARLAVLRTIGNHFTVSGIVTENSGKTLINGNAELDGDTILMHVTASGYGAGEVHGLLGYAELDADTLEGFFVAVELHCNGTDDPNCGAELNDGQFLEPVACP